MDAHADVTFCAHIWQFWEAEKCLSLWNYRIMDSAAINLLDSLGWQQMIQEVVFMLERDVELFIEHCELKGLSPKTIGSYEQTMRLFIRFSNEQGIVQTEKATHMMVQNDISVN